MMENRGYRVKGGRCDLRSESTFSESEMLLASRKRFSENPTTPVSKINYPCVENQLTMIPVFVSGRHGWMHSVPAMCTIVAK